MTTRATCGGSGRWGGSGCTAALCRTAARASRSRGRTRRLTAAAARTGSSGTAIPLGSSTPLKWCARNPSDCTGATRYWWG
ncbi:hypothetical protein C1I97_35840 [Streptomyces sp. NTH33]|nr:hypothetical protein C1I97_35840 [Streptomyces sp. NTH33]